MRLKELLFAAVLVCSSAINAQAPSPITDLLASNTTETTTDLTWSTPAGTVTEYKVYQDGYPNEIGTTTDIFFNVTGLSFNTSYDFTVIAFNLTEGSTISNTQTVLTLDVTPPVTISDLAASNITETTVDLTWSTTDNIGVTDYEVFQDITGVGSPVSIGLTGGTAAMNVSGLILGTSYDFTVYAQDAAGNISLVSNTAIVLTVDVTPPSNVTNLSASNTTETSTDLAWDTATDNIAVTGYEVYQNTNSGGDVLVASPTTNSASIGSLVIGDSNDFTIYAKDAAGNSSVAPSNVVNVVTVDITPPVTITDLSANNITETTVDLTWSTTDNVGVTNYEVFQDISGVGSPVSIGLTGGTTTMNVTGLTLGSSYDFTVYAQDAASNVSSVSNTVVVVTVDITPPATVNDLTSSNVTDTTASLSWSPVSDNIGVVNYEIFQDDVSIGFSGGLSSFDVTSLTELTVYRFKVTALDAAGNSSALSNVEIVETIKESNSTSYTNLNSNSINFDWTARNIFAFGSIGVGVLPSPNYKLAVGGNIIAEEVKVSLQANWPDYVFEKEYYLTPLSEVEAFIEEYGHLKHIPSAENAEKDGISLGEMNSLLLRKIEELTLYTIQQEKKINDLNQKNEQLQSLNKRLQEIEKILADLNK